VEAADGRVGVAVTVLETGDTLSVDGNGRFPMQSVYKFPLALAVLDRVDNGELSLDRKIHIKREDLHEGTWSPIREKYPQGDIDLTLGELLAFTVSQSDNNGCDILFRLVGGPETVGRFIRDLGINDIAIASTEKEMHGDWNLQYANWSTPAAMNRLLGVFHGAGILSESRRESPWHIMMKTGTGPGRIRGLLPEGTVVAHKTGSSGKGENGITAATNDVGIVVLPGGNHLVVSVFVSDSGADTKTCEGVIAKIAKAAWDGFSAR